MIRALTIVAALCAIAITTYDTYLYGQNVALQSCIDQMPPDAPADTNQPTAPPWWHHRPAHREASQRPPQRATSHTLARAAQ